MLKLLIVDDHAVPQALANLLSSKDEYEVVGQAENGQIAVEMARELEPDLVLMDLHMPVLDGVTATREILRQNPQCVVVILTMSEEGADLFAALEAGARGYLLKSTAPAEFYRQIDRIMQGNAPITDPFAGKILAAMVHRHAHTEALSERESEVMELVAEGLTNREIAEKLYISENTVKKHISNIMSKLGLENRTQLARYQIRHQRA